ncbi:MAG: hypothetical protein JXN63_01920 [Candidatus Delongbacteria bacterium]|nr:hypothetical protein [Candidatus Delongbacteria bacterium]
MKRRKTVAVILSALTLFIFTACHTETPLGIDNTAPSVEIMYVYSGSDTLYNYTSDSLFVNFTDTLFTEVWKIKAKVQDNREIHKIKLIAEDIEGSEYEVTGTESISNGEIIINSYYKDYPIIQDSVYQEFYLKLAVSDESENTTVSGTKLGFKIAKPFPLILLYEELGLIKEIEGDSIDFREKNGKLAFVQFMYKGCLSCVEEARDVKAMYQDPSYDIEKYSHSMFGRSFDSEKEFLDYKLKIERLPFDCFLDQPDNTAKGFFEKLTGEVIETAFFAVMPNGMIVEFKYDMDFPVWLDLMYSTAYPNN